MPTYQPAQTDVLKMVAIILALYDSHKPLLEHKVRVDVLMVYGDRDEDTGDLITNALNLHGMPALGICRILNIKDRVMGRGDAEICLDADHWAVIPDAQKRALLDHELHHIALKVKKGQVLYDDIGRPLLKLRKHDVQIGWFAMIAERHGEASVERIQAKGIMDAAGQYFWPGLTDHQPSKKLTDGKSK